MGHIIKKKDRYEYRQEDGETTAWFSRIRKKMELSHKGNPEYKKIFYILISTGLFYLLIVFLFVH